MCDDFVTVCSSHVAHYRSELSEFITVCTMDYVIAITVVTLWSPGECCFGHCFLGTCCLHLKDYRHFSTLKKMGRQHFPSKTLVPSNHTPEICNFNAHHCENMISQEKAFYMCISLKIGVTMKGNTDINRDCNSLKTSLNGILPAFSARFH